MTASTTITLPRTGPAVRSALTRWAPGECPKFEAEFQHAVAEATQSYDLAPVEAVVDHWWRIAASRAHPLTAEEQDQLRRARAGDFSGLLLQSEDSSFKRL